ncbi:MAG: PAS domain-containing protein, partial [Acidimicrobiia bacterium]|nr:PAS domain-containing protein [Acidimicrobiia bacterium]
MPDTGEHVASPAPPVRELLDPIPGPISLLRWVYVGRMCLALAIAVAAAVNSAALGIGVLSTGQVVAVVAIVFLTAGFTGGSYIHTHYRRETPTAGFLYGQYLFDLGLVTAVVHLTGGVNSDFASLYILVIGVAAVTMPFRSALLVTLGAATMYFTDSVFGSPVPLSLAVWLQIGVFLVVALATSWLASRVRVVGARRQELEKEVKRLRLEATDILREISGGIVTVRGDGTLVYANASAQRLLGFAAADFQDQPFLDFLAGRSAELWTAIVATQREGRRLVRAEGTILLTGRSFPIGVTTTAHQVDGEGIPSVTAIFTDISDQKRLNELNTR